MVESWDVVVVRGASLDVIWSRMFCRIRVGLIVLQLNVEKSKVMSAWPLEPTYMVGVAILANFTDMQLWRARVHAILLMVGLEGC